jgi:hypothetical protein
VLKTQALQLLGVGAEHVGTGRGAGVGVGRHGVG